MGLRKALNLTCGLWAGRISDIDEEVMVTKVLDELENLGLGDQQEAGPQCYVRDRAADRSQRLGIEGSE